VLVALLLAAPHAWADRGVVLAGPGGDAVATGFVAEVLLHEVHAAGQHEVRMGDPAPMFDCSAVDVACLGHVADRSEVDVVFLADVRRDGEQARLFLTRYLTAARTTESRAVTIIGSRDGFALAARSRVRRFLAGRQAAGRGALLVRSAPPGASILLDGEVAGRTPRILDGLFVGPHLVELRRDGSEPENRTALVASATVSEVMVALSPEQGLLRPPAGATLVAGGATVGLAVLAGATGLALRRVQGEFDATGAATHDNVEDLIALRDRGESLATAVNLLLGATGAALLSTGWLYYRDISGGAGRTATARTAPDVAR